MSEETVPKCTDPTVGRLLPEALSGALRPESRDKDRWLFEQHTKQCRACRKALIDHLNETVTMPALRQFAEENGLTFDEVCEVFRHGMKESQASN